jgi:hypothetical protein
LVSKLARSVSNHFRNKSLMALLYPNGADRVANCFVFTPISLPDENLLHDSARHAIMASITQ